MNDRFAEREAGSSQASMLGYKSERLKAIGGRFVEERRAFTCFSMCGIGPPEPEQKSTTFHLAALPSPCPSPSELGLEELSSIERKTSRITVAASSAGDWGCSRGMRCVQCFVRVFWAHCFTRKGTLFGRWD